MNLREFVKAEAQRKADNRRARVAATAEKNRRRARKEIVANAPELRAQRAGESAKVRERAEFLGNRGKPRPDVSRYGTQNAPNLADTWRFDTVAEYDDDADRFTPCAYSTRKGKS